MNCEREVVAKCGDVRIWHWAHLGKLECDHWWEPETEWHRSWKSMFPRDGRKSYMSLIVASATLQDVKTPAGLVVELQHSPIAPEERLSRESFYKSMVGWWTVGATSAI